jgi:hypothetical protein
MGLLLSSFIDRTTARIAGGSAAVRHNARVIRRAKKRVGVVIDRSAILAALEESRGQ